MSLYMQLPPALKQLAQTFRLQCQTLRPKYPKFYVLIQYCVVKEQSVLMLCFFKWGTLDSAGFVLSFVGFCWIRTEFCWILLDAYWVLLDSAASFFSIWASSWRRVSKLRNMIHTVDRKWDVTKWQCAMCAPWVIQRVGYEGPKERAMNSVSEVSVRNIHVGTHVY